MSGEGAGIPGFGRFIGGKFGGAEGTRTPDPHNAIVVLYQLSYDPTPNPAAKLANLSGRVKRRICPALVPAEPQFWHRAAR